MAKKKSKSLFNQQQTQTKNTTEYLRKDITVVPRTQTQSRLLKLLNNDDISMTFAIGPAGTGKTYIAARFAIKQLHNNLIEKIVITRPRVQNGGEKFGALPGGIVEKMEPWMLPIIDSFCDGGVYDKKQIMNLMERGIIEICPFEFMRGRSLKNSIIIADEMQNSTPEQMKMLLTRLGEGSKMIITGDLDQSDLKGINGLECFLEKLDRYEKDERNLPYFGIVEFDMSEIVRHKIIPYILSLYDEI